HGRARISAAQVLAFLLVIGPSLLLSANCLALDDETFSGNGPFTVFVNVDMEGEITYDIWGSAFDAYFVTEGNLQKLLDGEQFGYIDRLSVLNTTSANVTGNVAAGKYATVVFPHDGGTVHFSYHVEYPNENTLAYIALIVIILAAGVSAVGLRYWHVRKQRKE
ncbi:MAG: hypothetical protein FJY85_16615, partial [Deltaproteobacteria bacterium]|nr:hypothetical protein [Deltaproteobacteria bacterium]